MEMMHKRLLTVMVLAGLGIGAFYLHKKMMCKKEQLVKIQSTADQMSPRDQIKSRLFPGAPEPG